MKKNQMLLLAVAAVAGYFVYTKYIKKTTTTTTAGLPLNMGYGYSNDGQLGIYPMVTR